MPDTIGFTFGTAVLMAAFTIFGILGRILDVVAGEIRYTIAPAMVDGVRAWGRETGAGGRRRVASEGAAGGEGSDAADGTGGSPGGVPGDGEMAASGGRDPGLVTPVQAVPRRGPRLVAITPLRG
jgi:hypothetical protein